MIITEEILDGMSCKRYILGMNVSQYLVKGEFFWKKNKSLHVKTGAV